MSKIVETISAIKNKSTGIVRTLEDHINEPKVDKVIRISIENIVREEPFSSLNPVDDAQRARLADSIRRNGFMKSNPLLLWRVKRNLKWAYVLIDGYSRCAVMESIMGPKSEVWAIVHDYMSLEEAVTAARYQEYSRRHDDAKSLYRQFEELNLESLKNEPGRLNEIVAKQLGISAHNAHKLLQINAKASDDIKSALREGTISAASAFKTITNEKKYSVKNKAFINGVQFCLDKLAENKSPDKILELANTYLEQEKEGKK